MTKQSNEIVATCLKDIIEENTEDLSDEDYIDVLEMLIEEIEVMLDAIRHGS